MTSPLAPKMTVPTNMPRMRVAVSTCCSGLKPGASTYWTMGRAKIAASPASTARTRVIRLSMRLKSSQAGRLSSLSQ